VTTIQPCLVPCKGTLADLHVVDDPNNSDTIQVFWGTSVLQVIPRNKNSVIFRLVAGLLAMLKFKMSSICETFDISEKTLRQWREALSRGDWDGVSEIFHGPGMPKKLRVDVEAYVRARYREATNHRAVPTPHGFRKKLIEEVKNYWQIDISEETLRQVFRNEDQKLEAAKAEGKEPKDSPDPKETTVFVREGNAYPMGERGDGEQNSLVPVSLMEDSNLIEREGSDRDIDKDVSGNNREESCAIKTNPLSMSDEMDNVPCVSAVEPAIHPKSLMDNSACERAQDREKREEVCADQINSASGNGKSNKIAPGLAATLSLSKKKLPCCLARSSSLLWSKLPDSPIISQHAGLVILSSWFDESFSSHPPIIAQTAAQILCGAVIPEQSKLIDYTGLEAFMGDVIRDIDHQHTLLSQNSHWETIFNVYGSNAQLLKLKAHRIFYFDPHHEKYTGIENVLIGWNGCSHCMCKGIMLDFIHTEWGSPCFIGHFDTFYDCRQRFLILRRRFMELFPGQPTGFVWIQDRGFWGLAFLGQIADEGDFFIQWEKNYKNSRWDKPFLKCGRFTLRRYRNSRKDRLRYRYQWREQTWDAIADGRRIIVRARHPKGKTIEVSIVTNHPSMSSEKIIRLMFNRWLQEGDFAYLNRHFGINQLTGRIFDSYEKIANDLQDRQVDSRAYKFAQATKKKLVAKIGQLLVHFQGQERVSLDGLTAQREKIKEKVDHISQELDRLESGELTHKAVSRIGQKIQRIRARLSDYKKKQKKEQDFQEKEQKIKTFTSELEQLKQQLVQISKTESRILACIEEGRVRPDMRKKALVDAIRITSRNTFRQAFDIFRPLYDNRRDDHVVLRALTRSSGIIIPCRDRIDVYLTPQLQREPAEWQRIQKFIHICEHRIAERFPLTIRIFTRKTSAEILYAANRASSRFQ